MSELGAKAYQLLTDILREPGDAANRMILRDMLEELKPNQTSHDLSLLLADDGCWTMERDFDKWLLVWNVIPVGLKRGAAYISANAEKVKIARTSVLPTCSTGNKCSGNSTGWLGAGRETEWQWMCERCCMSLAVKRTKRKRKAKEPQA